MVRAACLTLTVKVSYRFAATDQQMQGAQKIILKVKVAVVIVVCKVVLPFQAIHFLQVLLPSFSNVANFHFTLSNVLNLSVSSQKCA